ncbi:DUF6545 domain-containing protein [Streptomyces violascens]|uniref:DUF6545 domain-containing protein n=1 Tax=Streptomyces violascens TaxID=67381 RepID=UPI001679EB02|nr:DUF6545 domain-containing protein [Streptomyces violascens]GGU38190.1 hypothetical protein GCM10010289_68970 [Streptomyces violascens]
MIHDFIALLMAVPLWTAVIWRSKSLLNTRGQRSLWCCFLFLAIGATLRLAAIETWVIDVTGVEEVVSVSKHVAIIMAGLLMLRWCDASAPDPEPTPMWRKLAHDRPRNILAIIAVTLAIATAPLASPSILEGEHRVFLEAQYGHAGGTLSLAAYIVVSGASMYMSGYLSTMAARKDGKRLLKICMTIFTTGCWSGAAYFTFVGVYLAYGLTGASAPLSLSLVQVIGNLLQLVCIVALAVGSSVRGFDNVMNLRRYRRWLIQLRPLWLDLASVLPPDAIVKVLNEGTSLAHDRRSLRGLYNRLDQRTLDITDSAVPLATWIEAKLPGRALAASKLEGLRGDNAQAAAEAFALRIAREQYVHQQDPSETPSEVAPLTLSNDPEETHAWLARVSYYYQQDELMDAIADRIDALEPA